MDLGIDVGNLYLECGQTRTIFRVVCPMGCSLSAQEWRLLAAFGTLLHLRHDGITLA